MAAFIKMGTNNGRGKGFEITRNVSQEQMVHACNLSYFGG
jgi:hypothetical protein